ncbi:endonuclease [Bacteroidales bacterium OttesenSCG-928-M06]|nr:endonuclease [Bacteroidales bacterium OttesenSCG-928-M06]
MKPNLIILIITFFLFTSHSEAQTTFRTLFYNVENLFDTEDNPEKADDEFTPEGVRHWTKKRYWTKIKNIAQVIISTGEWNYPALIGMCEIENDKVLKDLTRYSPLKHANYQYILTQSPDLRGINIALLYQRDQFKYLQHTAIRLYFPHDKEKKTRDILHVSGIIITQDTLDIFLCHFPSRRGGELQSEADRMYTADILRKNVDSLFQVRKNANIIIMGDFNDEPSDKSISSSLKAYYPIYPFNHTDLYNLFLPLSKKSKIGSYKYQDEWNLLDQIIVSGNLLNQERNFFVDSKSTQIFQADFLLTSDKAYSGRRPKKSYHGYKYEGGFSDHLPVMVDFRIKKNNK